MKPSTLAKHAWISILAISFLYVSVTLHIWPKAPSFITLPGLIAGAVTHYYLARHLAKRYQQRSAALLCSRPCYVKWLGLLALCQQLTATAGVYTAESASRHVTVDIASFFDFAGYEFWQIDITTCQPHSIDPNNDDGIYEFRVVIYVLVPNESVVRRTVIVVHKTMEQAMQDGHQVSNDTTKLDGLDEQHHAFIGESLEQVECIVASKLR